MIVITKSPASLFGLSAPLIPAGTELELGNAFIAYPGAKPSEKLFDVISGPWRGILVDITADSIEIKND